MNSARRKKYSRAPKFAWRRRKSSPTARCKPRALPTAETGRVRRSDVVLPAGCAFGLDPFRQFPWLRLSARLAAGHVHRRCRKPGAGAHLRAVVRRSGRACRARGDWTSPVGAAGGRLLRLLCFDWRGGTRRVDKAVFLTLAPRTLRVTTAINNNPIPPSSELM